MIGKKAGQALALLDGIRACKKGGESAGLWQGIMARLVLDLDAAGPQDALRALVALLSGVWDESPHLDGVHAAPAVSPTGNEVADMATSQLARALAGGGAGEDDAVRRAEHFRRVFARAYGREGDGAREMPAAPLTPRQRYEEACARFGEATAAAGRVRAAVHRMSEDAEREYEEAKAHLATFEESPGIPLAEYREAPGDGGS